MKSVSEIVFSHAHTSRIYIGEVVEGLTKLIDGRRAIVFIDAEVEAAHSLSDSFRESIVIPAGEENKNLELVSMIWSELVESKADRKTVLVAIGGGVVCDMVAFAASTFMRGIGLILAPSTLLAQVDAAIGGKCGINFGGYKNMVGAFAPAEGVICDARLLSSLPQREFAAGVAEMLKAAIIGDQELFNIFENNNIYSIRNDSSLLSEMIHRSLMVKCDIVARDPYERGERQMLNLGHTFAHAIESLSSELTHGEAVAVGVVMASRIAAERGLLPQEEAARIQEVIASYGLPVATQLPAEAIEEAMSHDKKRVDNRVKIVLPVRIGECCIAEL